MVDENGTNNVTDSESMEVDWNDVIQRCSKNERKAQGELYALLAPKMYGVALRYAANQKNADKILQDSFIYIFKNIKTLELTSENITAEIKNIICNKAIHFYKKWTEKKFLKVPSIIDRSDQKEETASVAIKKSSLQFVQALSETNRLIYNAIAIDKYSDNEIAKHFRITEFMVEKFINEAQQELSGKVKEVIEEDFE